MDRGEKWMGVHGGGVEDWNTATAENLRRAKSGFSETSNELDEAMADALSRIDRGGRMMHGVDRADSIRRMNMIEAMEGFPLSNRPAGKSDVVEDMIYGENRKKMNQMERWQKNHPGEDPLGQGDAWENSDDLFEEGGRYKKDALSVKEVVENKRLDDAEWAASKRLDAISEEPMKTIILFQEEVIPKLTNEQYRSYQNMARTPGMTREELAEMIHLEFGDLFDTIF